MLESPLPLSGLPLGTGLTPWAEPQPMPVIPVLASGDGLASLHVAEWLSRAAAQLGYQTTLLLGDLEEDDARGGLLDILEHRQNALPTGLGPSPTARMGDWPAVYPAAQGLRQLLGLAQTPAQACRTLSQAFSAYTAMTLHADAHTLGRLIDAQQHIPVLAMPPEPDALLDAYDQLKLLAGHQPVGRALVVTLRDASVPAPVSANIFSSFSRCAQKYLGCRLHHCDLEQPQDDDQVLATVRRWAIPMLRSRQAPTLAAPRRHTTSKPSPALWSH